MISAPISELATDSSMRAIFAEWLGQYFDGGAHAVGNAGSPTFPLAGFAFGEGPVAAQPLGAGGGAPGVEIRLVVMPRSDLALPATTSLYSGRLVFDRALLQFWVSGRQPGRGNSQKVAETAAELLKAILQNPATAGDLNDRGIYKLQPRLPEAIGAGTDYAKFLVTCAAEFQYPIQFGGCTDPDANAFTKAAGITNAAQANALCLLVTSLKSYGLWALLDAVYPLVGGTAASTSYNLKNPAAYQIAWNGGVTFSAAGVTGDGSTGYGDTGFNPATAGGNYAISSASLGVNLATGIPENAYLMGIVFTSAAALQLQTTLETLAGLNSIQVRSGTPAKLNGFLAASAANSLSETLYLTDGTTMSFSPVPTAVPNLTMGLLARNFGGTFNAFSAQTLSFAFIGGGLSSTQMGLLKAAVTAFNLALARL